MSLLARNAALLKTIMTPKYFAIAIAIVKHTITMVAVISFLITI